MPSAGGHPPRPNSMATTALLACNIRNRFGVRIVILHCSHGRTHMRQTFARRSILTYCLGGAGAALLAFTSRSQAAPTTFKATLSGASEVPANTTAGSGSATITLDGT